jgi:hypothetical protein
VCSAQRTGSAGDDPEAAARPVRRTNQPRGLPGLEGGESQPPGIRSHTQPSNRGANNVASDTAGGGGHRAILPAQRWTGSSSGPRLRHKPGASGGDRQAAGRGQIPLMHWRRRLALVLLICLASGAEFGRRVRPVDAATLADRRHRLVERCSLFCDLLYLV